MGWNDFLYGVVFGWVLLIALYWTPTPSSWSSALEASTSYPTYDLSRIDGAVFITGCSSGIGRHAAVALARDGSCHVFATVRNERDAQSLRNEPGTNGRLHPVLCDVTDPLQVAKASELVRAWLNKDDEESDTTSSSSSSKPRKLLGIVNNAGIVTEVELFEHVSMKSFDDIVNVNMKGPILVYQAFLPLLRDDNGSGMHGRHPGRIVNVGSLAGIASRPFRGLYTTTKYALEGLTDTIRQELLHERISVSMINPGLIRDTAIAARAIDATRKKYGGSDRYQSFLTEAQQRMLRGFYAMHENGFEYAPDSSSTTQDIKHALFDPKPRTRYYPGIMGALFQGRILLPAWMVPKLRALLSDRQYDTSMIRRLSAAATATETETTKAT